MRVKAYARRATATRRSRVAGWVIVAGEPMIVLELPPAGLIVADVGHALSVDLHGLYDGGGCVGERDGDAVAPTRAQAQQALARVQQLSDEYWHHLDAPARWMDNKTWLGGRAPAFQHEITARQRRLWRDFTNAIDELHHLAGQLHDKAS